MAPNGRPPANTDRRCGTISSKAEGARAMLRTQTSNLPLDQQQRLHADFLKNEQDYLRVRDRLLTTHSGQWVAVAEGRLIACGTDLMRVTQQATDHGGHPYVAKVGEE